MSDMETPEYATIDGQLSSYYHDLADAAVPVRLHGRIVATLESRGRRRFDVRGRGLRLSRFAPAAVVVLAVAAVALAALPWSQHGATAPASQIAPGSSSSKGAASPSGGLTVTVMNLGHGWLQVGLNGEIAEKLTCGESGTYQVANPEPVLSLSADDGSGMYGSIGPYDLPTHIWLVELATGEYIYDTQPSASDLYTMCPTKVLGADPSGRVSWDLQIPVVQGNTARATAMNNTIGAAVQAVLSPARDSVLATPADTAIITSLYYVYGPGAMKSRMLSLQLDFTVAAEPVRSIYQAVNIDMSDGHGMTIDELFTSPSAALAVLSSASVKLLPVGAAGSVQTAPTADNFSDWLPWSDGLQLNLKTLDPNSSWNGTAVKIPWSVLESLLKPDSPVWDYIAVH